MEEDLRELERERETLNILQREAFPHVKIRQVIVSWKLSVL